MTNKNKNRKKSPSPIDLPLLVALTIAGSILSWQLPLNYLESILVMLGPSVLYLSYKNRKTVKLASIFAASFLLAGTAMDYFGMNDRAWSTRTIFPLKIGGVVPFEDLIWFFLLVYLTIMYYEFFYDHSAHAAIGKRMKYLYLIALLLFVSVPISVLYVGHVFQINFFYLKSGILFVLLPIAAFSFKFPRFISSLLKTIPYFLGLNFLLEMIGLHKHFWSFPGYHYVGWVSLGSFHFPWEELIFWMVLFSSATIIYFEIFDNNRLKLKPRT